MRLCLVAAERGFSAQVRMCNTIDKRPYGMEIEKRDQERTTPWLYYILMSRHEGGSLATGIDEVLDAHSVSTKGKGPCLIPISLPSMVSRPGAGGAVGGSTGIDKTTYCSQFGSARSIADGLGS